MVLWGATMTSSSAAEPVQVVFAGGCFWCMQPPFDNTPGVLATEVGYAGGHVPNPTYEQVSRGDTGHLEVIRVTYEPSIVSYSQLLDIFWHNIDPTQGDGQFVDRGPQYHSAIFVGSDEERRLAEASKAALEASGKFASPIATDIRDAATFYPAEDYHQQYYRKNGLHYQMYKQGSGRAGFIEYHWGDRGH